MDQTLERRRKALRRKLDKYAIDQLRAEVVRLAEDLDSAERDRNFAQDSADYWESQCRSLEDQICHIGASVGLTRSGDLVAVTEGLNDGS